MRAIVLRIVVLLGAIVVWFGAWAVVRANRPPDANALIAPLLPQGEGQSVCLTGSFTDQVMDVEDWSKSKMEPTKHLSPDGKPYMRPVPPVMKDMSVRSFTLQLVYDTREADYDWIHNFRLLAEVEGVGTMYASGECPWYAKDKVRGPDKREITGNTTNIGCYIDCDGGGFDLERVAGSRGAVDVVRPQVRPPDEGRLRRWRKRIASSPSPPGSPSGCRPPAPRPASRSRNGPAAERLDAVIPVLACPGRPGSPGSMSPQTPERAVDGSRASVAAPHARRRCVASPFPR